MAVQCIERDDFALTGAIFCTGLPSKDPLSASGCVMFFSAARLRVIASTALLKADPSQARSAAKTYSCRRSAIRRTRPPRSL